MVSKLYEIEIICEKQNGDLSPTQQSRVGKNAMKDTLLGGCIKTIENIIKDCDIIPRVDGSRNGYSLLLSTTQS